MEHKAQCLVTQCVYPGETTFWRHDVMFLNLTWASRIEILASKGLRPNIEVSQVYKSQETLGKASEVVRYALH